MFMIFLDPVVLIYRKIVILYYYLMHNPINDGILFSSYKSELTESIYTIYLLCIILGICIFSR